MRAQIDVRLEMEPVLITVEQMMALCQIGQHKAFEWTHRKGFPVIREGQLVLIPLDGLKQWLAERAAESDATETTMSTPLGVLAIGEPERRQYRIGSFVGPRPDGWAT